MRRLVLVVAALAFAVSVSPTPKAQSQDIWLQIAPSGFAGGSAAVRVVNSNLYVGGNMAAVATARGDDPIRFSIRGWRDGDRAQAIVFAMLTDKRAPEGFTETPIATFTIAPGQSVEVAESEKWGGAPLRVTASLR